MAAKQCADITPSGIRQADEVDLYYDIVSSIQGVCQKLDNDAGASIVLTTYEANCFTAIFNCRIEDTKGNIVENIQDPSTTVPEPVFITPRGIGARERVDLLYMILNSIQTLAAQIDTDNAASSDYEATYFTAMILYLIENSKAQTVGNGTLSRFHTGYANNKELIELWYQILNSISGILTALDGDGNADTDYVSLWFTANILLTVENAAGAKIGN